MRQNKRAFTIIELIISTTFFSILLMMILFGFMQINRSYTKGVTVKTIQESARSLLDDISKQVRVSSTLVYSEGGEGFRLCFDGVRYIWNQFIPGPAYQTSEETFTDTSEKINMIRVYDNAGCDSGVTEADAEKILDDRANIQLLRRAQIADRSYLLTLVVATEQATESDLSAFGEDAECRPQVIDQFCDVAKFETVVTRRN